MLRSVWVCVAIYVWCLNWLKRLICQETAKVSPHPLQKPNWIYPIRLLVQVVSWQTVARPIWDPGIYNWPKIREQLRFCSNRISDFLFTFRICYFFVLKKKKHIWRSYIRKRKRRQQAILRNCKKFSIQCEHTCAHCVMQHATNPELVIQLFLYFSPHSTLFCFFSNLF